MINARGSSLMPSNSMSEPMPMIPALDMGMRTLEDDIVSIGASNTI